MPARLVVDSPVVLHTDQIEAEAVVRKQRLGQVTEHSFDLNWSVPRCDPVEVSLSERSRAG
jgi:hypothetical protein